LEPGGNREGSGTVAACGGFSRPGPSLRRASGRRPPPNQSGSTLCRVRRRVRRSAALDTSWQPFSRQARSEV